MAFTGAQSIAAAGSRAERHVIVAGNPLASDEVMDACLSGLERSVGPFAERLLAALDAAAAAGGDRRGLMSAALLVVGRGQAPLTLRIDKSADPLTDLRALHDVATGGDYAD